MIFFFLEYRTLTLRATFLIVTQGERQGLLVTPRAYLQDELTQNAAAHVGCIAPPSVRRGLDRSRALAPRSPARLARSNDPHPVQSNGIGKRHLS